MGRDIPKCVFTHAYSDTRPTYMCCSTVVSLVCYAVIAIAARTDGRTRTTDGRLTVRPCVHRRGDFHSCIATVWFMVVPKTDDHRLTVRHYLLSKQNVISRSTTPIDVPR